MANTREPPDVAHVPTRAGAYAPAADRDPGEVPCLVVITGELRGRVVPLPIGTSHVGRDPSSHLQLTDDGVSRRHVAIELASDGIVTVRDLGSTNGTFLNGARIERAAIREGDRVQVGPHVTLRFGVRTREELAQRGTAAPPAPAPLSDRELEVAQLAVRGLTNDEIARRLHVSASTVKTHLRHVYARLEVHSRLALREYLHERGLLGDER